VVRIIAYACLGISAALAAVYGYTTGNTEAMGLLRALGWAAVAFVGGCCPAWFFSHLEDKSYGRAVFTGVVALVCAGVTLNGSIGGITGTGDKYAAERAKTLEAAKSDRATLATVTRERDTMIFTPATSEVVEAARSAVATAERNRISECGANNERRGTRCRERELEEQAKRDALSIAVTNKVASDRAAKLDTDAAAIRARLDKAPAMQNANPGAAAVSRLLGIEVDDAVSWQALLGALALELAGMAAMMRADSRKLPSKEAGVTDAPAQAVEQTAPPIASPLAEASMLAPAGPDIVGRFMLACLRKASGEEVVGGAIYARHQRWCSEQEPPLFALDPRSFAQQFAARCERHGIRTRRDGSKVYCVDVQLVA
jgi:hypothetical protein